MKIDEREDYGEVCESGMGMLSPAAGLLPFYTDR
jgi:hypothetical protein